MSARAPETPQTFFRQSGWMMITTTVSGVFMLTVHIFNKYIPNGEYGLFTALLSMLGIMQIPTIGVQGVFAQQTAAALTDEDQRRLAHTTRSVLAGTFIVWLIMVLVAFAWRQQILATLQIQNPAALWITLLLGLIALWSPIFAGILQGRQNFFWIGWATLSSGIGRVCVIALFVVVLHGHAAGMMAGILCSTLPVLGIYLWQSRTVWNRAGSGFAWRAWLWRVLPLTLGLGGSVFIFSVDVLLVRSFFPREMTGAYGAIATVGRAIVTFTAPIVAVMFPKIVASLARSEKSNALTLTLGSTAALGVCAVLGLFLLGGLLFRVVYPDFVSMAPLSALYALCILPQALGNVLLNNLLAQSRHRVVPWIVLMAAGYFTAISFHHDSFREVILVLGIFSLLYLALTAVFSVSGRRSAVRN